MDDARREIPFIFPFLPSHTSLSISGVESYYGQIHIVFDRGVVDLKHPMMTALHVSFSAILTFFVCAERFQDAYSPAGLT